jgi:sugar phosphate isomerase/epimerase
MGEPRFGAFARLWPRSTAVEVAGAMAAAEAATAQWNFSAVGEPSISGELATDLYTEVRDAFGRAGVGLWALSCTYNVTHPDIQRRRELQLAATAMIRHAPLLGVDVVTICAGSRDPDGWTFHPDNASEAAWAEMREELEPLLAAARHSGLRLGIEPEPGSIVSDAERARRLLEELGDGSPVGIVLDPWNLVAHEPAQSRRALLADTFSRLGRACVAVHAKDPLSRTFHGAALDYGTIAELHAQFTSTVPVIIQDVREDDFADTLRFLRQAWLPAGAPVPASADG